MKEDIIAMARRAGAHDDGNEVRFVELRYLERFAALVRADEREACAKVCEEKSASYSERAIRPEKDRDINPEVARIAVQTCGHVAAAIRARGKHEQVTHTRRVVDVLRHYLEKVFKGVG
jgi:hypothetical protein